MNYNLIEQIYKNDKSKIYFHKRVKKCDNIDLTIYKILNYLFENNSYSLFYGKTDMVMLLISYWQKLLKSLKKSVVDDDNDVIYNTFVEGFNFHTKEFTFNTKIELLYRLPWHIMSLVHSGPKRKLNAKFIKNIAEFKELSEMNFANDGWKEINIVDKIAAYTIYDDVMLKQEELLSDQLQNNLHMILIAIDDVEELMKTGNVEIEDKDKHAYCIIAFIVKSYIEEKDNIMFEFYDFLCLTIFKICFWHVEATELEIKWSFKKSKLVSLKEWFQRTVKIK